MPVLRGEAEIVASLARNVPYYSVTCVSDTPCMGDSMSDDLGDFSCDFPTTQEAADAWNTRADVTP